LSIRRRSPVGEDAVEEEGAVEEEASVAAVEEEVSAAAVEEVASLVAQGLAAPDLPSGHRLPAAPARAHRHSPAGLRVVSVDREEA
jgi:hypothetical protein